MGIHNCTTQDNNERVMPKKLNTILNSVKLTRENNIDQKPGDENSIN
jgi:hypothetical protein